MTPALAVWLLLKGALAGALMALMLIAIGLARYGVSVFDDLGNRRLVLVAFLVSWIATTAIGLWDRRRG